MSSKPFFKTFAGRSIYSLTVGTPISAQPIKVKRVDITAAYSGVTAGMYVISISTQKLLGLADSTILICSVNKNAQITLEDIDLSELFAAASANDDFLTLTFAATLDENI